MKTFCSLLYFTSITYTYTRQQIVKNIVKCAIVTSNALNDR